MKAFFINVYNSLTVHAFVYQANQVAFPESPVKVDTAWSVFSIVVSLACGRITNCEPYPEFVFGSGSVSKWETVTMPNIVWKEL
jgi:hypothetical protein